jgi:general secretion pathway protein E
MAVGGLDASSIQILRGTPIFSGASDEDIAQLVPYFEKKNFVKGDPIFLAQGVCEYVWVIAKGSVEILSYDPLSKTSRQIAILNHGQQFAEVAALTGTRHSAGAFALEDTELLALRADWFRQVLSQRIKFAQNMARWLAKLAQSSMENRKHIEIFNDAEQRSSDDGLTKAVPIEFVNQFSILPLELLGKRLTVGCLEPLNPEIYENLRRRNPDLEIKPMILNTEQFKVCKLSMTKAYTSGQALGTKPAPQRSLAPPVISAKEVFEFSLMFSQFDEDAQKKLAQIMTPVAYSKGEIICGVEQEIDRAILIASGEVELFRRATGLNLYQPLVKQTQNDLVFGMPSLTGQPGGIGVLALTDVTGLEMTQDAFVELMKLIEFVMPLCIFLAQFIRQINHSKASMDIFSENDTPGAKSNLPNLPENFQKLHGLLILGVENHEILVGSTKRLSPEATLGLKNAFAGYRFKEKLVSKTYIDALRTTIMGAGATGARQDYLRPTIELLKIGKDDSVNILERIILEAASHRASDVHIESREQSLVIRYRIDGSLVSLWEEMPKALGTEVVRRAKMLAKMDIAESRMPQDGRFNVHKGTIDVELRVSVVPTRHGEKVVMRLIGKRGEIISLKQLASDRRTTSFLNRVAKFRQGIFLVSGPTGSGKSTTLYSMLAHLSSIDSNIVTIEDPIEANIPGINQIEVNSAIDLNPSVLLRHVLRQDPDVIMVGEIRDVESMKLALEASMTGHLVLSTIHASSSLEVMPRLKELGVTSGSIAANLIGVMAQRLVRALCNHCKKPRPLSATEHSRMRALFGEIEGLTQSMHPAGCAKCFNSGYLGQLPIFEFWERSRKVRSALLDNADTEHFVDAVRASGFESLEQYGLRAVANGNTSFAEVDAAFFGLGWEDDQDEGEENPDLNIKKKSA